MASDELTYELHGHVGVITINRPEARNALTWSTYAALESAVRNSDATMPRHHRRPTRRSAPATT